MAENPRIPIVLLCALPASGKSETRKYLESLGPEECKRNFGIGETVQLDDYPYVHMMREIDKAMLAVGMPRVFFASEESCFTDGYEWGTLIQLLNEDYEDLIHKRFHVNLNATTWLFDRIDLARKACGRDPHFANLTKEQEARLAGVLEAGARKVIDDLNKEMRKDLAGKTVVIEFARGGPENSSFPLRAPVGYEYSLSQLSRSILSKAAMLYIWVTPEESRRKNLARARKGEDGSILFHGVPEYVMRNDYGCDDLEYLLSVSDRPNTIKVQCPAGQFYVPVGRLDNRVDLTTFIHAKPEQWRPRDKAVLRGAMQRAFAALLEQFHALHPQ